MNWIVTVSVLAAFITASAAQNEDQKGCIHSYGNPNQCKDACPKLYDTLFTTAECVDGATCKNICSFKLEIWSTIFLFAGMVAIVVVLVLLLPLCCVSCCSCFAARKGSKRSKQLTIGGGGGGDPQMNGMEVVPTKGGGGGGQQQMMYNPYAYWPYYGRM